jgi:hypothetical protein
LAQGNSSLAGREPTACRPGQTDIVSFLPPPRSAAWLHREAREGFEVVFFEEAGGGYVVSGATAAVEEGAAWAVEYSIALDSEWRTQRAEVTGRSAGGRGTVVLESAEPGRWLVDGVADESIDGCLDVDLESSSLTNAFPVRRMALAVGESDEAPAAYVRALDLGVQRLPQSYERLPDADGSQRFHYESPDHGFAAELRYDEFGLVRDYPGIAVRAA